jgi:hypothetical protein
MSICTACLVTVTSRPFSFYFYLFGDRRAHYHSSCHVEDMRKTGPGGNVLARTRSGRQRSLVCGSAVDDNMPATHKFIRNAHRGDGNGAPDAHGGQSDWTGHRD